MVSPYVNGDGSPTPEECIQRILVYARILCKPRKFLQSNKHTIGKIQYWYKELERARRVHAK